MELMCRSVRYQGRPTSLRLSALRDAHNGPGATRTSSRKALGLLCGLNLTQLGHSRAPVRRLAWVEARTTRSFVPTGVRALTGR